MSVTYMIYGPIMDAYNAGVVTIIEDARRAAVPNGYNYSHNVWTRYTAIDLDLVFGDATLRLFLDPTEWLGSYRASCRHAMRTRGLITDNLRMLNQMIQSVAPGDDDVEIPDVLCGMTVRVSCSETLGPPQGWCIESILLPHSGVSLPGAIVRGAGK